MSSTATGSIPEDAIRSADEPRPRESPHCESMNELETVSTTSGDSSPTTPEMFVEEEISCTSSAKSESVPLFVFDYDDTLFPTTFLASLGYSLESSRATPEVQSVLNALAKEVEETLRQADEIGRVVILTNAEDGWIELTSKKFMPTVNEYICSFPIVSARSTYEPMGITNPYIWKLRAFDNVMREHLAMCPAGYCLVSLGDSIHERDAAHQVSSVIESIVCKTVKFIERPDVGNLVKQHSLVRECLPKILDNSNTLDLCIQPSSTPHSTS
jgi:hypothetical protein